MTDARLDWGAAARACAGETEIGDRYLVKQVEGGVLLAAADGLGHGAEAARAAGLAIGTVERNAGRPLLEIVGACHKALQRTRGAALSLALWDAGRKAVTWVGVGNVEGLLVANGGEAKPARERLVLRPGVVGDRLPALLAWTVAVPRQGLLVFTTDGIEGGFEITLEAGVAPQALADRILERHSRSSDDALVLVARLGG